MTAGLSVGPPAPVLPILTAVTGAFEAALVTGFDAAGSPVRVVRRCADLGELLSAADAGLARAAVISADLHRLDGDALARLAACGVAVVALVEPGHPQARDQADRLFALGVRHVVDADLPPARVAELVVASRPPSTPPPSGQPLTDMRPVAEPLPSVWRTPDASVAPPATAPVVAVDPVPADRPSVGRLVAVWGPVGSPGRTSVAVTLAAEIAALGRTAMLADADTYGPSIAQVLGLLDESAGLGAAVRAAMQGALDPQRLARLAPLVAPQLRVLTGLPRPGRWPELRPAGLDLVWENARGVADWTVVDCGFALEADEEITFDTTAPRRNGATLSALAAADVVLAVGTADPVGLQRLVRGLQELADVLPPGRTPRVVVTRVRAGAVGSPANQRVADALSRYAGVSDAVLVPDDRPAFDAALMAGRTVTEVAAGSPARRALAALAAELAVGPGADRSSGRRRGSARRSGRATRREDLVPTALA